MNTRRRLLLLVTVAATITLVSSSSAFTSSTVDRHVQVQTAEDSAAFVGFEQNTSNSSDGTTDLTVTIRNQFPGDTTLSAVDVHVGEDNADLAADGPIPSGGTETVTFDNVSCEGDIEVEAAGTGLEVRFVRSVACS